VPSPGEITVTRGGEVLHGVGSPDDRVSGVVDIATPDGAPGGQGPPLTVPGDLSSDVSVERYEQDGYIGSRVRFEDLSFEDVTRVMPTISPSSTCQVSGALLTFTHPDRSLP